MLSVLFSFQGGVGNERYNNGHPQKEGEETGAG